jgi:hypothetical protein
VRSRTFQATIGIRTKGKEILTSAALPDRQPNSHSKAQKPVKMTNNTN